MKRLAILIMVMSLFPVIVWSQIRNDAGLRGDAGATSGFFEAYEPVNFPTGATNWWHLLDVRHSRPDNNHAMQFSGSFFDQYLYFRKTNNNPATPWSRVLLETNGKVGVGTLNPSTELEVNGTAIIYNKNGNNFNENLRLPSSQYGSASIALGAIPGTSGTGYGQWTLLKFSEEQASKFSIRHFHTGHLTILTNGNVGIGTEDPTERLSVNGNIRAKEIKVETNNWPDYIFEEEYKLKSLSEVETFIKTNKHLPDVPSAREIEEEGLSLGEMNKLMMKKIEELTLYLIEKDKEIQRLNKLLIKDK
ncbi:hypothetical protein ACFU8T_13375 [Sphingobacterium spiritivorum]|uniref:Uncharacterized protein n=1 Tax=Sphingobacterium spiritivorum ATCC 33861 TaxID=525373 RepID=D7VJW5_SPHSI|nr:hypothetical protein [Sphingobacterium spiritivorum]EFK58567.1 hypothetical protein HMPREF0766_11284 [Sphingobacterium spiritivorum ATCC 33861]QQT34523.1 hypothetical protein I6J01_14525 [Sphingobacterium spiritivorum]WQD35386.1 hypothetical protein U0038_06460 [Sphingobacterium spiritivorum]SUJ00293.1 Uncharacterised protein [Sphingobacterium spiritivorum]